MLTGVRVKKHPDHRDMTWFRLFLDGELINSISVDDCLADELERLLTPAAPDALPCAKCIEDGLCNSIVYSEECLEKAKRG
jgi:hypothetical protein